MTTIQELVDAAAALDPSVRVVVRDSFEYQAGRDPIRRTIADVSSSMKGAGSREEITVEVAPDGSVSLVTPGVTTLFWQADALMRAFRGRAIPR